MSPARASTATEAARRGSANSGHEPSRPACGGLIEPLLVTYGVNVTYLTGFESSNCALLVEPGGETTLYSDFRYAEAAQAVDGVEFVRPNAMS